MNRRFKETCMIFLAVIIAAMSHAQNIIILDTVGADPLKKSSLSESSFSVRGKIEGMDSGTLVLLSYDKQHLADVPFRHGHFFFSGDIKSVEQVGISIMNDYYRHAFFIQPGDIKIDWRFRGRFTVTGTRENDLTVYFCDTLNQGFFRFGEISNKMDSAMKIGDLDLYVSFLDSFSIAEKNFFSTVEQTIQINGASYYLLPFVNFYPVSYGYFNERRLIFERFPESVKNSVMGRQVLHLLNEMEKKRIPQI